jgi:hypothetical protein
MSIDVLDRVREIDPLDPAEPHAWHSAETQARILGTAVASIETKESRRRILPIAAGATVVVAGSAGIAIAAGVLGGPAPDPIKAHLAELDRGMPADLRYAADVDNARAVAATDSGTLYLADLAGGGYCIEVAAPPSRPRGASCVTAAQEASMPLDVTAPIPGDAAPLLVGGRANDGRITRIQTRYADGGTSTVDFGIDRGWLLQIPDAERDSALTDGLTVVGLDDDARPIASAQVPPLRDDDPLGTAHDDQMPIFVATVSDGSDFTLVLAVRGRVNLPADGLVLRYPDGSRQAIPLDAEGRFDLRLPAARQDDFARTPGRLIATRDGKVVATAPVQSVAAARAAGN